MESSTGIAYDSITPMHLGVARELPSGAVVFPVQFAIPEVVIRDGVRELVTAEVLSDPDYVNALPGTSVIITDGALHRRVPSIETDAGNIGGSIHTARFDPTVKPLGALVGTILVDRPQGIRRIRRDGVRGVSLTSLYSFDPAPPGSGHDRVQTRRWDPMNLALTLNPRATARIAADGGMMDPSPALIALLATHGIPLADVPDGVLPMGEALLAAEAKIAELTAAAEQGAAMPAAPGAGHWRTVLDVAAAHGVEVPADSDYDAALSIVATKVIPAGAPVDVASLDRNGRLLALAMASKTPRAEIADDSAGNTAGGFSAGSRQGERPGGDPATKGRTNIIELMKRRHVGGGK